MWNAFAAQPVGPLRGPFKNIKILLFHENSPISSGIPYTTELLHPTLGSLGCWSGIPRSRIGMVLWKPLHEHRIKITVVVESHPRSQTTICCSSHWIAASTYGSLDFSPSLRIKKGGMLLLCRSFSAWREDQLPSSLAIWIQGEAARCFLEEMSDRWAVLCPGHLAGTMVIITVSIREILQFGAVLAHLIVSLDSTKKTTSFRTWTP